MPTKGTATITIRVREEVAEAIAAEARRRRITRNKALALFLEDRFFVADDSQKTDRLSRLPERPQVKDIDEDD